MFFRIFFSLALLRKMRTREIARWKPCMSVRAPRRSRKATRKLRTRSLQQIQKKCFFHHFLVLATKSERLSVSYSHTSVAKQEGHTYSVD